jgi:hypothetical protein
VRSTLAEAMAQGRAASPSTGWWLSVDHVGGGDAGSLRRGSARISAAAEEYMGSAPAAHSGQKIIRSGLRFLRLGEVVQMPAVWPRRSGLVGEGSRRRRRRAGLVVVEKS